ncbi:MAG TPA: ABC transporter ATP-binding protein [Longimicrobium sp.]|nr:ABC transporter ATP-binding protein [Longimicrobium sp.]
MYAMETRGLTHRFGGGDPVVRDLDLRVPTGSIYGFLGPNGAGKTTTLRLVLGLLGQQAGTIHLLGRPLRRHREALLRQVGSSIESPSLYAHLTAHENLRIWQLVFRCPARRIGEVLALVGLEDTGSKPAGQFSLGMKQRLSLAVALLHEPRLLVLDEPTNGLDPHGIVEMRDLLVRLNREHGTTIVVSSHLLSEVERLVTDVAIISRGSLRFQGPLAELMARRDEASFITVDTTDNARALAVIAAGGWAARPHEGKVRVAPLPPAELGRMNRCLVLDGLGVHEIAAGGTRLETLFMDLVQD